jgi:hypothetical protein
MLSRLKQIKHTYLKTTTASFLAILSNREALIRAIEKAAQKERARVDQHNDSHFHDLVHFALDLTEILAEVMVTNSSGVPAKSERQLFTVTPKVP